MKIEKLVDKYLGEQSAYQKFFKEMLEKEGKSIPKMSNDERKAFFNKVSREWKKKKGE